MADKPPKLESLRELLPFGKSYRNRSEGYKEMWKDLGSMMIPRWNGMVDRIHKLEQEIVRIKNGR